MIGRASKTEQKQLLPAVDNGWIRNPVISRHHAVLTLEPSEAVGTHPNTLSHPDTDPPAIQKADVVYIQDKKSSHGTYVNGENIQLTKRPLQDGDKIRFGSEVMRGEGESTWLLRRWSSYSVPPVSRLWLDFETW